MTNIRRWIVVCLLAVLFLGWFIFGYYTGITLTEKAYTGTVKNDCKVEIDEDTGEVVIHTTVGNLKTVDGCLIVNRRME